MLLNYLRIALRNIRKNKVTSFINIAGLAIGLSCCVFIMLYIQDELSYDKFHKNGNQIYRVSSVKYSDAKSPMPLGPAIALESPEISASVRIRISEFSFPVVFYKTKAFNERKFALADTNFFNVFSAEFLKGNPSSALSAPNNIVITESAAQRYFGNEDPLGKPLQNTMTGICYVSGVIKDFPENSHFHFDLIAPIPPQYNNADNSWTSSSCYTYLLLKKDADPVYVKQKMNAIIKRYNSPQLSSIAGDFEHPVFDLQKMTSIHLSSHLHNEIEPNSDILYIYILSTIAFALLLIASINYINLAIAKSESKMQEIGIRKTVGAGKLQIIGQILGESLILTMTAFVIAVALVEILLPTFNNIVQKHLKLNLFNNPFTLPSLIFFGIFTSILAGGYPAFYMSSFKPIKILKKEIGGGKRRSFIKSGLIVFQFVVSLIVITSAFIIYSQINFIQNKNLGFNEEQIIIVKRTNNLGKFRQESFRQELLKDSRILAATSSTNVPGHSWSNGSDICNALSCDEYFAETYQIKMLQGRFFSKEYSSDNSYVVVNKKALRFFNIKDPLNNYLDYWDNQGKPKKYNIIGVTDDFLSGSLQEPIQALVIMPFNKNGFGEYVSVRFSAGDVRGVVSFIEDTWTKFAHNIKFEYSFLDQDLENFYIEVERTGRTMAIFSVLTVFISCLGLFSLSAYNIKQRTKELAIRKVFGATASEIVILLSKEFTAWIITANIIALPVSFIIMTKWLEDFAFRIQLSIWYFIIPGISILIIALLTAAFNTLSAAADNQIKLLRHE